MNIVCFMPIRLNSKRVAGKSVKLLGGRPLFCWLLEQLDQVGLPVYLYCSNPDYLADLIDFAPGNVHFLRRDVALDGDQVKGIEIYKAFAEQVPADAYLLCHCTSPFVKAETIQRVIAPVLAGRTECSLTVRRVQTFVWHDGRPLNFDLPRTQTQNLQPIFIETSAAYCYKAAVLAAGDRSDLTPELIELSYPEDDDIDTEDDFRRCEGLLDLLKQTSGHDSAD